MAQRCYPDWIKAYMEHTKSLEAPDTFHFWTAVATIAGALRRQVWFDQKLFQWTPNFYILLVAPPGIVQKSTAINIGFSMLRRIDSIRIGPNAITWQALVQSLAAAAQPVQLPGGRLLIMSAMSIAASEMGTLIDPRDRALMDALTDLWDCKVGPWEKVTKGSGSDKIMNPWLNIIAGTTPGWIAENMPEAAVAGGFTSRCIFVYENSKRYYNAYPEDGLTDEFAQREKNLIHDLEMIAMMRGPYLLSSEAKEWGREWYEYHFKHVPPELAGERYGGYVARKQCHCHKLAMVLAAAQGGELLITLQHLQAAVAIISSLEYGMPKVFQHIGASDGARQANDVLTLVRSTGGMEIQEAYQRLFRSMSYNDFVGAVESAVAAGLLKQVGTRLEIGNAR